MKKARVILIWALVLLLCAGCSSSGAKVAKPSIDYPPYCGEFLKVVGKDMKEVLPALGLTAEDFRDETQTGGWYILNQNVEYLGQTFEMRLATTAGKDGARYVQELVYSLREESPEAGAQTVTDLRDQLLKGYGTAYNAPKYADGNYGEEETREPSPLNTMDKAALLEQFTADGGYSESLQWLLSTDVSNLPKEALSLWSDPPTCVTGVLETVYPVAEDGKTVVLTQLTFGLSRDYRDLGKG